MNTQTSAPADDMNRRIGRRVRHMIFGRITQKELAQALGTTQSGISRRIHGETEFTPYELYVTSRKLGVTVDALLSEVQPLDYKATVSRVAEVVDLAARRAPLQRAA